MAEGLRQLIHTGISDPASPASSLRTGTTLKGTLAGVLLMPLMLVLSWSVGGCMANTGADNQPPGEEALNGRFRKLAFEQLSFKVERSSPLSPPAQRVIEEFIAAGARRLSVDGATPEKVSAAEVNLNRFVSQLSETANVREQSDITPETVAATRERLCPLYPFC
jgi:hypothetical protein